MLSNRVRLQVCKTRSKLAIPAKAMLGAASLIRTSGCEVFIMCSQTTKYEQENNLFYG